MLTVLEILMIAANIPVLLWALLPIKRIPRFLDFMPLASVLFLVLHLFIDVEPVRLRFVPIYIFTILFFLGTLVRIFRHNPDQPKRRILAGVGRIFGLSILTVSVLIPTVVLPFHPLPEPSGNFDVGTVVYDLTDENRIETFSEENGKARKIAVEFWYPTDKTDTKNSHGNVGASISTSESKYPVLIFSHGAFGMRKSNASTFRELASHGYIVASIDHTYHSFYTVFSDGKGVPVNTNFLNQAMEVSADTLSGEETYKITHDWLDVRTADMELVIDCLKEGKLNHDDWLNDHMDLTRIGLFGHSLGGAAAAQVSRNRDDIKGAIVMDGTMIGDIVGLDEDKNDILTTKSFNKPLMLMYGDLYQEKYFKSTSYAPNINAFKNATQTAYSLCIMDSGHLNFTDLPEISPFLSSMLGVGTIDSYQCIEIVNKYTLAFFDEHVKGQPSSLLDGTTSDKKIEIEKNTPK